MEAFSLHNSNLSQIRNDHQHRIKLLISKLNWSSYDQLNQGLTTIINHLIKIIGDKLKIIKDELSAIIFSKLRDADVKEKIIGDNLMINLMTTSILHLYYKNRVIMDEIILINCLDSKLCKDKAEEFINKLLNMMATAISNSIETCLACFVNSLAIESFTRSCDSLNSSAKQFYSEIGADMGFIISKPQTDFIFQFFEDKSSKMIESIECDDFSNLKIVSPFYQAIVDFIEEKSFKSLKDSDKESVIVEFEKLSFANSQNEFNSKGMIKIMTKQFKCCCSTLEVIKFVIETIKLFILFDELYQDQIYMQVSQF